MFFEDKNILIFCPKCSRLINVLLFNLNLFQSKKNISFTYFCSSCYEYINKNKTKEKIIITEKTIKENNQSINLLDYFKQFFYKPKTACKIHPHNKMCLFYNKKAKEYICISCVLEQNEKIKSNIYLLNA